MKKIEIREKKDHIKKISSNFLRVLCASLTLVNGPIYGMEENKEEKRLSLFKRGGGLATEKNKEKKHLSKKNAAKQTSSKNKIGRKKSKEKEETLKKADSALEEIIGQLKSYHEKEMMSQLSLETSKEKGMGRERDLPRHSVSIAGATISKQEADKEKRRKVLLRSSSRRQVRSQGFLSQETGKLVSMPVLAIGRGPKRPDDKVIVKVLSIDGGGIRGIVAARILEAIERNTEKGLTFDLVAGTSAGGIIAAALATGMTAKEISSILVEKGPLIFSPQAQHWLWQRLYNSAKFDPSDLYDLLGKTFEDKTLKDAKTDLLITAHNLSEGEPGDFYSPRAGDPSHNYLLREVTAASSAAAPILPYVWATSENKVKELFADGGISGVNNPSMEALSRITEQYPNARVLLVSIGTGKTPSPKYKDSTSQSGSVGAIVTDMVSGFDALAKRAHLQASRMVRPLGDEKMYFRLNPRITKLEGAMDNVSEENIRSLLRVSKTFVESKKKKISTISYLLDFLNPKLVKALLTTPRDMEMEDTPRSDISSSASSSSEDTLTQLTISSEEGDTDNKALGDKNLPF
jgi:patatin-like phospholipase/acyl hydrolase